MIVSRHCRCLVDSFSNKRKQPTRTKLSSSLLLESAKTFSCNLDFDLLLCYAADSDSSKQRKTAGIDQQSNAIILLVVWWKPMYIKHSPYAQNRILSATVHTGHNRLLTSWIRARRQKFGRRLSTSWIRGVRQPKRGRRRRNPIP